MICPSSEKMAVVCELLLPDGNYHAHAIANHARRHILPGPLDIPAVGIRKMHGIGKDGS